MEKYSGWAIVTNVILWGGLILSLIFTVMAVLMPIIYKLGFLYVGDIMNNFLGNFCHQMPSRSFMLLGYPVGLCIRCFAIYAGFSFSSVYLIWRGRNNIPHPLLSIVLITLMFIEVATRQYTGFVNGFNTSRLITGLLFGTGCSAFLLNFRSTNYKLIT